jgi:excisionase family DNA binding protein
VIDSTDATPQPRTRRVTIAEAARILGVSGETVRRRIHAGQLEAIREVRPQGSSWRVVLPIRKSVETTRGGHTTPRVETDQEEKQVTDATSVEATPATTDVASSAALVASISRLIVELAEVRTISDRRADRVVEVERDNARLIAELEATAAEAITLKIGLHKLEAAAAAHAEQVAGLREDRGRLTAELERAAGTVVALSDEMERLRAPAPFMEARTEPAPVEASTTVPGRLAALRGRQWLVLAVLVVALLLAGVLLFVPQ